MAGSSPNRPAADPLAQRWRARYDSRPGSPRAVGRPAAANPWDRRRLALWAVLVLSAVIIGAGWRLWQILGTVSAAAPDGADPSVVSASTSGAPANPAEEGLTGPTQDPLTPDLAGRGGPALPEIAPGVTVPPSRAVYPDDPEPDWGAGILWDSTALPMNILLMGTDADGLRTDVVWLARIDPVNRAMSILRMPRDLAVAVPGGGGKYPRADKVAHLHAYWDDHYAGHERAVAAVSSLLGVKIHRYIVVNMKAFTQAVDLVGGVEVEVPRDMEYEDPYQDLRISIPKGSQLLNGEQALHVARWRQDNTGIGYGDLGRSEMQRALIQALFQKAIRPANLVRLTRAVPDFLRLVRTNLSNAEVLAMAALAPKLELDALRWFTLPGTAPEPGDPAFGFYLADVDQIPAVVSQWRGETATASTDGEEQG